MNRYASWGCVVSLLALLPQPGIADPCGDLFCRLNARHIEIIRTVSPSVTAQQGGALHVLESQLFDALAQCPKDADLFALMGELQIILGQLPLATVYGRKSVELNERSWRGQQLLGSALAMLGQVQDGLPHLERAVALAPENPRLRLNLASALLAAKEYARVRNMCEALIQSGDADVVPAAYNLRGQAYLREGALSEAGRDFAAAEKLGFDARRSLIDVKTMQRRVLDNPAGESPSSRQP